MKYRKTENWSRVLRSHEAGDNVNHSCKFCLLLLSMLLATSGCRKGTENLRCSDKVAVVRKVSDLEEGEIPELRSEKWYEVMHGVDVGVFTESEMVMARTEAKSMYSNELHVENGAFVGCDNGEWGGSVVFVPNFGMGYEVLGKNFHGFYMIAGRPYALVGMSHLAIDEGYIYRLDLVGNRWKAEMIVDLDSCPMAFLQVNENLYVATNHSLVVVRDDKLAYTLVDKAFWEGLYPNSMVSFDNAIYIGMRGGVYEYNFAAETERWYDFMGAK